MYRPPRSVVDNGGAPVLYRDRWIECTTEAVRIHGYYFPWGTKTIPYDRIHGMREFKMGLSTGQWRIWGSGDFRHWFNLDPGRTKKVRALVLDLGRFARPVLTPDDPDQVKAIIEARHRSGGEDAAAQTLSHEA